MRKHYMLIVSLVLVSLLLTGCLGGTNTKYVYDGSPTALEVVIKRDAVGPMALSALSDEPEPSVAHVRIWRINNKGQIIYSVRREVPIDPTKATYTLAEELPAQPGYNISAMHADRDGFFEIAEQTINAPADIVTTANIALTPLQFTTHAPEEMYSGGYLGQFWIEFPEEYDHLLDYGILLGLSPWTENGVGGTTFFERTDMHNFYLPEVHDIQTMYYQMVVFAKEGTYRGKQIERPTGFFPSVSPNTEPPHIELLPSPRP